MSTRFTLQVALISLLFMLCSGCTTVSGTSTTFFEVPLPPKGTEVVLLPGEDMSGLEWSAYREQFSMSLQKAGYRVGVQPQPGSWYAVVRWGMGNDSTEQNIASPIVNGQGQVIGVSNRARSLHLRRVFVDVFQTDPRDTARATRPAAQVRVVSTGRSEDIAAVMPCLAKMVFAKWPDAKSGRAYELEEFMP